MKLRPSAATSTARLLSGAQLCAGPPSDRRSEVLRPSCPSACRAAPCPSAGDGPADGQPATGFCAHESTTDL
eukprot:2482288-Prymnesium_polylepis.1